MFNLVILSLFLILILSVSEISLADEHKSKKDMEKSNSSENSSND